MQRTKTPAIPKDIEQVKKDYWHMKSQLRMAQIDNIELRKQNALFEKVFNMVDGYFNLKDEPELEKDFKNCETRLKAAIEIAKAQGKRNIYGFTNTRHSRKEVI